MGIKTRGFSATTPRRYYGMDWTDSDSDNDSISSHGSSISNATSSKIRYVEPLRVVSPLNLAPSSDDLLLEPENILQALGIYEVLRHFSRIIRLSPFRFEDFCGAIQTPEQSSLLACIHVALLRFLLSEDDASGLTFAASDEKDSFNILVYCLGDFTWPEHIRSYISSDKSEFGDIVPAVSGNDNPFPFTTVENRLKVLQRLCDQFLASNSVREGSDETLYYSCKAHLDELISSLEDDGKEKRLLSALKAKYKTMVKHMEITEALTEAAREIFCLV
ncbi:hypothetical protein OS493_003196 [Desmophyllum pertusum]|uniref:DDT domain-containing protein n=1 Tax=Desmophyllum pertusum TaxID=174260 RepID=A0A9X0CIZ6_9CNID|nr:hypothetical protein OS493_003196 [Desmophyllum pertusum]